MRTGPKKGRKQTSGKRAERAARKAAIASAMRASPLRVDGLSLRVEQAMAKIKARDLFDEKNTGTPKFDKAAGRYLYLRNFRVTGRRKTSPGHFIVLLFEGAQFLSAKGGCTIRRLGDGYSALKVGKRAFRVQSTRSYLFVDQSDVPIPTTEFLSSELSDVGTGKVKFLETARPE